MTPVNVERMGSSRLHRVATVEDVFLQRGEEGLYGGVVAGRTDSSHRFDKPMASQVTYECA